MFNLSARLHLNCTEDIIMEYSQTVSKRIYSSQHNVCMCVKERGRDDYWGIVSRFNK